MSKHDKTVMRKIEANGMTVSMAAVYNFDTDNSGYEVSKVLAGEVLSKFSTQELYGAHQVYDQYKREIGAAELPDNVEKECDIE